jgi:hypothetical protein
MHSVALRSAVEGVQITLTDSGKFKITGPRHAVARVISDLRPTVEALRSRPCPDGTTPGRFERLRQAALRFAVEYAPEAVQLGWSLDELFAIAEPFARVDLQGAAWFIGDATVVEVTAAAITLRRSSGSTTRIYRKSLQ